MSEAKVIPVEVRKRNDRKSYLTKSNPSEIRDKYPFLSAGDYRCLV
jgi:hypothetical protein